MNNLDKKYTALLQDILDNGVEKKDRTGTGTISVFGRQIRHKMSEGFPLLTTKKMYMKGIVTELLWFLRGDTNIQYLVDNDCHIWDGDAYKNYISKGGKDYSEKSMKQISSHFSKEEFINKIKTDNEFAKTWGELGPVYGRQWRSWKSFEHEYGEDENGDDFIGMWKGKEKIDQIANLINDLKTNPDSRRLMVNAWNVGEIDEMVLPPCHYGFQVYTRELSFNERLDIAGKNNGYEYPNRINVTKEDNKFWNEWLFEKNVPTRAVSLMWNQRSVDTFLGLPFNIASYGLLLEIIAKEVNMVPDELIGNLGDVHLYSNHIEQAKEQIGRELSLDERREIANLKQNDIHYGEFISPMTIEHWDRINIPIRTREPYPLPILKIAENGPSIIEKIRYWRSGDFVIENYQSHPTIKAPLSN